MTVNALFSRKQKSKSQATSRKSKKRLFLKYFLQKTEAPQHSSLVTLGMATQWTELLYMCAGWDGYSHTHHHHKVSVCARSHTSTWKVEVQPSMGKTAVVLKYKTSTHTNTTMAKLKWNILIYFIIIFPNHWVKKIWACLSWLLPIFSVVVCVEYI